MSLTFIRFVIERLDENSGKKMGLFAALNELQESELLPYEEEALNNLKKWFKKNLVAPHVLASESNYYNEPMAISWFKSTSKIHIEKMREYTQILESHGFYVTQLVTKLPGKILYEDEYQIAAIPFNNTFK